MQKAKAVLEALIVFSLALMLLTLVSLSPVGMWERQALGRPFIEYTVMAAVPLLVLIATRRSLAAYGLSVRHVSYHLDIAASAFVPVAAAGALAAFVDYRGRNGSLVLAAAQVGALLASGWLLKRKPTAREAGIVSAAILPLAHRHILNPGGIGNAASALIFYVFFLGFGEEVLFRGYVQSRLNTAFGRLFRLFGVPWGWGVVLAAGLFGLMHVFNLGSLVSGQWQPTPWWGLWTFFAGLVFGFVREKSGSIMAPAILHGLPQGIAYAVLGL